MKTKPNWDECCSQCELATEIMQGEYFVCRKKGVVEPGEVCRHFTFDPLKMKVSVSKIPSFIPLTEQK